MFRHMSRKTIRVPGILTPGTAFNFCRSLQNLDAHDEYVFDFTQTRTVEPFGMLLVSSEIRRCKATHRSAQFSCANFKHMTYAGHMGFFKAFGLDFGKGPGEAQGSRSYIPLTILESDALVEAAASKGHEVGSEIEEHSKKLSATLIGEDAGDVFETMAYSIREIMRNVVEHAQTNQFGICAQYWKTKGRAEVAILDRGVGLRKTLSRNPHIDASSDKSAINYALMPAVSGKAFKGAKQVNKGSPWVNSGFGLYMTNRICRNGGNFLISSGDTGMLLTGGKGGKRYFPASLNGTAVRMTIMTNQLPNLREALARYRDDGYEIQRKYREIVSIDPSSASLMLSEDFDPSVWDKMLRKIKSIV